MASPSHLDTFVSDYEFFEYDGFDIMYKELNKRLEKYIDSWEEEMKNSEKEEQVKEVKNSLSLILEQKEKQFEMKKKEFVMKNQGQKVEIIEERDDIKVLKDVMRMKKMEEEHWEKELQTARKIRKTDFRHYYKMVTKIKKVSEERARIGAK
ncbi:hypothetical protein CAEBREN_06855 [Caenorhabditis brenneri]|uniref:Uncharacterized protein n=1 Tax=Caenorhabditis brenneri TaxID=135651 RepID=G0P0L2_CAEBE|nr:hypothetical protein CAEBREN_06855 [Caenorhabditis brenneri]